MAFMELGVDCWETIFDYTPLEDIHSMAQTCKRMQAIAGYYFKTNNPNARVKLFSKGQNISIDGIGINGFREHIDRLFVDSLNVENSHFIGNNFNSLRSINFNHTIFSSDKCQAMRKIFSQIECLTFWECAPEYDVDLYENILKWCIKLRTLKIGQSRGFFSFFGSNNNWLLQKYPTLEHIDLYMSEYKSLISFELRTFLEQNPNVKKMKIMGELIRDIWQSLMDSNCKLETLELVRGPLLTQTFLSDLNALYDRGFYQRLRIGPLSDANLNNLSLFRGLVDFSSFSSENVNIPNLMNLEMLALNIHARQDFGTFIQTNVARHQVKKLRIRLPAFSNVHLLFVIRHLPRLEKIICGRSFEKIINLPALNEERQKIPGARRVIIDVTEDVYLNTMRRFRDRNFSFVTIRRVSYHPNIVKWYECDVD